MAFSHYSTPPQILKLSSDLPFATTVVSTTIIKSGYSEIEINCPEGMVALNGAVSALYNGMDFGVIVLSIGPLFSSGRLGLQADGITDAPIGWRVTAYNAAYPLSATVKVGVVCAAMDNVVSVVDSTETGLWGYGELTVPCPEGKIAVGGGVDSIYDPWGDDRVSSSAPNETMSSWVGGYWVEIEGAGGYYDYKVASVCIDQSDITLLVNGNSMSAGSPTSREVPCPSGEIALGGGVYTSQITFPEPGYNSYCAVILDTSPMFEGGLTLNDMVDGENNPPIGWRGMAWNRNDFWGLTANFYAICWEPMRLYLPLVLR